MTDAPASNSNFRLYAYDTPQAVAESLANEILIQLQQAIDNRKFATLALSGGNTPKLLLQALSNRQFDWQQVWVTLVDDRCYPDTHERSNAKLLKDNLLQNRAKNAAFVPLYDAQHEADQGAAITSGRDLEFILKSGFDVVVLGMGLDGHTASFFRDAENYEQLVDRKTTPGVFFTKQPDNNFEKRITFSASALGTAKAVYLQLEGSDKLSLFNKITGSAQPAGYAIGRMLEHINSRLKVFYCP